LCVSDSACLSDYNDDHVNPYFGVLATAPNICDQSNHSSDDDDGGGGNVIAVDVCSQPGDVWMVNHCDVPLNPSAQTVGSIFSQNNLGGFVNASAALMVGFAGAFGVVTAGSAAAGFVVPVAAATAPSILAPPASIQSTFMANTWSFQIAGQDIMATRAFSNNLLGNWATTTPLLSSQQATSLLALPNPATYALPYTIPAGSPFYFGNVAPMFGQAGGGIQLWVPNFTPVIIGTPVKLP
jgi:hypothetical protein